MEKSYLIGHRGASGHAPENTYASFDLAVEMGADAIELDVHQTKDGKVVVIHDDSLERTTTGQGFINEKTYEEIKYLDAGSWFDKNFKGEKVPVLQELIERYKNKVDIVIDIKFGSEKYPYIENKINDLILINKIQNNTLIASTKITLLSNFKSLNGALKLGKIIKPQELWRTLFDPSSFVNKGGLLPHLVCLTPHWTVVNANLITMAKENNLKVYPWVVDKDRNIRTMLFRGVDGIITNYPDIGKKIIEKAD